MAKTPLRYPGGKSRTADFIIEHFPEKFSEYREPFVGGGSVFLSAKEKYPKKKYWINDLYKELYYFYRWMKLRPDEVIERIKVEKFVRGKDGKKMFNDLKNMISDKRVLQKIKAAFFFIINRVSFSGTTLSGGFSNEAFEKRFTDSSIERLKDFSKSLKKVRITNFDYEKVINKDGKNVFIYLDPPYAIENECLYGKNGELHKNFDHEHFAEVLKNCKHKWLITYNDCEYIRNLFSFANIIPFEASYGMKNVRKDKENIVQKGNEIIIKNY